MIIWFLGKILPFLLFLFLFYFWQKGQRLFVFQTLVAITFAYAVSEIIKHFFYLPRPFVAYNFTPLIPHEPDGSFPSSHVTALSALSTCIWLGNKKEGTLFFVGTLAVGLARVLAGLHYWYDILGGFVLGSLVSFFVTKAVSYFVEKY